MVKNLLQPWDILLPLARKAGADILEIYAQYDETIPFETKSDSSPVTVADERAHTIICDTLQQHFPNIPILSEEDLPENIYAWQADTFWLIDPLDGTKGFIQKRHDFTVNIALIQQQKPLLGVVYAPALDLLYYGSTENATAYLIENQEERRIQVVPQSFQPLRVLASQNHLSTATQSWIDQLAPYELVRYSSSLKICRIAEGVADLYPRLAPTGIWDTAAAHAILNAAGGRIQNLEQQELLYCPTQNLINPHFVASAAGIEHYLAGFYNRNSSIN